MAHYRMNQIEKGLRVIFRQEPCIVIDTEFHKPGKGDSMLRVTFAGLRSGRHLQITLAHKDSLTAADALDLDMIYLYRDEQAWHFIDPRTHEQYVADAAAMATAAQWLKGEETCRVTLWNGIPLTVTAPNFVALRVTDTDPGLRGDTSSGGGKSACLETGAVLRVPLFIGVGDTLRVDTRSGEYAGRASRGDA